MYFPGSAQAALKLDIFHDSIRKISKPISAKQQQLDLHKWFAFLRTDSSSAYISVSIFAP